MDYEPIIERIEPVGTAQPLERVPADHFAVVSYEGGRTTSVLPGQIIAGALNGARFDRGTLYRLV